MTTPLSGRCRHFRSPAPLAALLAALLAAGCASAPVPDAQFAVSHRAIDEALSAGAAESAPVELQSARDKMAQADAAFDAGHNDTARKFAEEAEVDASLAAARARTAHANLAAAEVQDSIRALRESLNPDSTVNPPATRGTP